MPALFDSSVQDAALDKIATSVMLRICSGTPATRATAVTNTLASVAVTGADFTKAAGNVDGRKTTVAAKSGVSVAATGTAAHYCLDDGTTLLARAEVNVASPGLTQGSTVNIPAVVFEVGAPVVV